MKLNQLVIAVALILSLSAQSCKKGGFWGIKGKGETVTEVKNIKNFNSIDLSIDADITYVQDSDYYVEVSAQKNIMSVLDIKTEGSELNIDFRRNITSHGKISLVIHSPEMFKIQVDGSGSVNVTNTIKGGNLDLDISGSGKISIAAVNLNRMNVNMSGSGKIYIYDGTSKSESINVSGSGIVNAEYVEALNGDADISGSGMVIINASETLDVNISGSGKVKYKGLPAITTDISGSGKLIHLD